MTIYSLNRYFFKRLRWRVPVSCLHMRSDPKEAGWQMAGKQCASSVHISTVRFGYSMVIESWLNDMINSIVNNTDTNSIIMVSCLHYIYRGTCSADVTC